MTQIQKSSSSSRTQVVIEQVALLLTSFIWTAVVLSVLVFFWVYQDLDTLPPILIEQLPESNAEAAPIAIVGTPTPTPWQGPPPTTTPTETLIPTATSTLVIGPPDLLPETLNFDDPTPIPVIIHTQEEVGDYVETPVTVQFVQPSPTATATPTPTNTPTPLPTATATTVVDSGSQSETQPSVIVDTPTATATSTPPPTATPIPPTATPAPILTSAEPSHVVIPAVNINTQVIPVGWRLVEQNGIQYSIWDVADYAIGWHNTTAKLGQAGNTVMAGHHNINGEVFRDLVNVEVGDEVIVYSGDTPYRYTIELKTIVKEKGEPPEVRRKNAQWIAETTDERITMVTCWPFTNNTHRVIVVAKPS
ncbi:MAG: sortase [Chloroflexota bacterium]